MNECRWKTVIYFQRNVNRILLNTKIGNTIRKLPRFIFISIHNFIFINVCITYVLVYESRNMSKKIMIGWCVVIFYYILRAFPKFTIYTKSPLKHLQLLAI